MGVYLLLIIIVILLLALFAFFLIRLSHKIASKYIKNKYLSWVCAFIPTLLFIIGLYLDFINAIVVDLHLLLIIAFVKFLFFIIKKILKKEINEYIPFIIGILITTIIMCNAYYNTYNVVETKYDVYTDKNIETNNFRIVQISDAHLGNTMNGKEFAKHMENIAKLEPDVVVVTGDFIDDDTLYNDFVDAATALGNVKTKYGVYFIYGNHDKGYYNSRSYNEEDIKNILNKNNVKILEDSYVELSNNIILIGRKDAEVKNRIKIQDLVNKLDKQKYLIVLDHQPNDFENETKSCVDLVLSGHTHGGQVFPVGQFGVLIGANDKIYGIEKRNNTTFIVNSGIGCWGLKFKTGTQSEYVVIDVKNDNIMNK